MSFAYMPLFTGDYLRDTPHLSMSEHGAYFKLLMYCWDQKGPAPLDERRLMGICNARSTDEIEAMRRVLADFFVRMDDGWYNKRIQAEIDRSEALSVKREDAGRRGANARMRKFRDSQAIANQVLSNCQASDANPIPIPRLSPTSDQETSRAEATTTSKPTARGTRLPAQWALTPELQTWARAERPDLDIAKSHDAFVDYWTSIPGARGTKLDWAATFRNWIRKESAPVQRKDKGPAWWESEKATIAKGREVGIEPGRGESMPEFRARVRAKVSA